MIIRFACTWYAYEQRCGAYRSQNGVAEARRSFNRFHGDTIRMFRSRTSRRSMIEGFPHSVVITNIVLCFN